MEAEAVEHLWATTLEGVLLLLLPPLQTLE